VTVFFGEVTFWSFFAGEAGDFEEKQVKRRAERLG